MMHTGGGVFTILAATALHQRDNTALLIPLAPMAYIFGMIQGATVSGSLTSYKGATRIGALSYTAILLAASAYSALDNVQKKQALQPSENSSRGRD